MRKNERNYHQEKLFYEKLINDINALFINNKNYDYGGVYTNLNTFDVIVQVKEHAKFLINQINNTKHLIIPNEEDSK